MSLYLRGNTWWCDFVCNGKRYRQSSGQTDKNEARQWEKNKIAEYRGESNATALFVKIKQSMVETNLCFVDAWEFFKTFPRKHSPGKQSLQRYQSAWDDFSLFAADNQCVSVADVTETMSQKYISHIREKGRYSPVTYMRGGKTVNIDVAKLSSGLSNATKNSYQASLSVIFDVLFKGKYCLENPFAGIEKLNNESVDREAFSPEELRIIGDKSKDTWLYPLFLAGICTGLREGDICMLKWTSIKDGWIEIKRTRKTGVEVQIPILPPLAAYIATLAHDGEYVFPELAKTYERDAAAISKAVKKFLASCGIAATRKEAGRSRVSSVKDIHSLRHTFAYIAAVNNIPLPIVQSVLGHMSAAMTKHYTDHARKEEKLKFLATLPDYLSSKPVSQKAAPDMKTIRERLETMTAQNWQKIKAELLEFLK